jgi:hypothetical protein
MQESAAGELAEHGAVERSDALNNSWRARLAFPLLAFTFTALMLGTTLPTPMYAL